MLLSLCTTCPHSTVYVHKRKSKCLHFCIPGSPVDHHWLAASEKLEAESVDNCEDLNLGPFVCNALVQKAFKPPVSLDSVRVISACEWTQAGSRCSVHKYYLR